MYNRLKCVNEAFSTVDYSNGGFLKGSKTADNIFILQGLIQRQLCYGKPLFVCFVDFSKAFDLVNRNILFYKLIKCGWHGRVIDTLRSLYAKTSIRIKRNNQVSSPFPNTIGVNQGGINSGLLFRKYLSDLSSYLNHECGICIGGDILLHMLWADDLILVSETASGLQKQLNALQVFCKHNYMSANESKTKFVVFGKHKPVAISYDRKEIEQVQHYKYLVVLINATATINSDIFKLTN